MENIINNVANLFKTYGFQATTIIILTIIVVNLIKKPVIKKAESFARLTGYDKALITKNITFLPIAVSFLIIVVVNVIVVKFNFAVLEWGKMTSEAVIYGAVAIATYETSKKHLEAYASKTKDVKKIPEEEKKEETKDEILQ